jgi:hypothetical protein
MHKAGLSKQAFFLLFAAKVDDPPDRSSTPIELFLYHRILLQSKLASELLEQREFDEPLLEAAASFFVCVTSASKAPVRLYGLRSNYGLLQHARNETDVLRRKIMEFAADAARW